MVDRRLHHPVQCLKQSFLIDIMLILAHTDGFGLYLDEFGEWVLHPSGDGYGASQGDIKVGQFIFCQFGG